MKQVSLRGEAPHIEVWLGTKRIETIRSEARLKKRIRQEGWRVKREPADSIAKLPVSLLASRIREEGESWSSALKRAHALQNP